MSAETLTWLRSLREILARLHRLVGDLKDEADSVRRTLLITYAGIALRDLRELLDARSPGPLDGDAMVAFHDADKLTRLAPPEEEKVEDGWRPTREYREYVASINPRSLDKMLSLLSGVPSQDPPAGASGNKTAKAPAIDYGGASVIFSYDSDPSHTTYEVTGEMLERERAVHNMVDCVPTAATLTVGQCARLLDDLAKLWPDPCQPVPAAYVRRSVVLHECPAWDEFELWANTVLGRDPNFDAARELQSRLARRLRKRFAEVDLMPLADAMAIIREPEATTDPPSPSGTVRASESESPIHPMSGSLNEQPMPWSGNQADPYYWRSNSDPPPALPGSLAARSQSVAQNAAQTRAQPTIEPKKVPAPDTSVKTTPEAPAPPSTAALRPLRGMDDERDTNSQVADELARTPHATAAQVATRIGVAEQTVRKKQAWKANRKRLKESRPQPQLHETRLSEKMRAVVSSNSADPAEIVAEREGQDESEAIESTELLRRRYLEGANPNQKARFYQMTPADQEHELASWNHTGIRGE
jgi:hypothetical protein